MGEPSKEEEVKKSFLSNKAYDTLKIIAAILPILGAFYFGLAEIWNLPYGGAVQATFALLASTLSAILIKLSYDYSKTQKLLAAQQVETSGETEVEELSEEDGAEAPEENIEEEAKG